MYSSAAIVIPTKDRLEWSIKLVNYYDQLQFDGTLLLVDSSLKQSKKTLMKHKGNLNLIYIHAPNKSVHQAVMLGLENLPSYVEFIIQTGDDDYICTEALGTMIDFLLSNPSYNAIYGKAFSIGIDQSLPDTTRIKWCRKYWNGYSVKNKNPLDRVEKILRKYTNLEFALRRKDSVFIGLKEMNKAFGKLDFSASTTLEVAAVIDTAIAGKICYINSNYLIRGDHEGRPNRLKKSLLYEYLTSNKFIQLKTYLSYRIDKSLNLKPEFIAMESDRIIIEYIESSITGRILKPYERNNVTSLFKKLYLNFQDRLNRIRLRKYLRIIRS